MRPVCAARNGSLPERRYTRPGKSRGGEREGGEARHHRHLLWRHLPGKRGPDAELHRVAGGEHADPSPAHRRNAFDECRERRGPGEAFAASYYTSEVEDTEYLALVRGDVHEACAKGDTVLVRVANMDPLADPFDLRPDLVHALDAIDRAGVGVFLYVMNRQRIRLGSSFERLVLQRDRSTMANLGGTSEALRDFGLGAQVLADLGCKKIRLMMWSDRKIPGLEGFGIDVVERVPIPPRQGARTKTAG
jgi:3,4-dihydroxy 2-butanone 4-phosphate synthase/GTP cyclohydrolase II